MLITTSYRHAFYILAVLGVPIAGIQKTTIRTFTVKGKEENEGEGFGLLTAHRIRHIRSALSWRSASTDNKHQSKLPENSTHSALSGQSGT
jgi:hypothetical protein